MLVQCNALSWPRVGWPRSGCLTAQCWSNNDTGDDLPNIGQRLTFQLTGSHYLRLRRCLGSWSGATSTHRRGIGGQHGLEISVGDRHMVLSGKWRSGSRRNLVGDGR